MAEAIHAVDAAFGRLPGVNRALILTGLAFYAPGGAGKCKKSYNEAELTPILALIEAEFQAFATYHTQISQNAYDKLQKLEILRWGVGKTPGRAKLFLLQCTRS